MNRPMNYVRLERELTESWITFRLAEPLQWEKLVDHLAFAMPGWELVSACEHNPDDEEIQANELWPDCTKHEHEEN